MGKKKVIDEDLIDFLFSWTIKDVFDQNLLKEKVKKIPTTFSSMEDYFGAYKYPLIEETRADLCSSLGLLSHAPLCKILHLEATPKELEYDICMEPQTSSCKEGYKPKGGDILALANVRPQSVSDLDGGGSSFNLAYVLRNEDDESGPPFDIKIRVSKQIEGPIGRMKSLFAVSLINITTNKRIWKALKTESSKDRNLDIVRNLLYTDSSVKGTCDLCSSAQLGNVLGGRLVHYLQSSKLNDSQISAVLGSILTSQCTHKNSIKLIWGPPGTGKTKTVSALLWTLLAMECRTLTCAPTNVAVLEVASRLLKLIKEPYPHELVPLGNIILFGNKDRMDIEGEDLEEVFLDFRVDRLSECFAPHSGWNHQLEKMVALLEDGVSQHQLYLELEKEKEKRKDGETEEEKIMNFWEFFIKRFSNIADKLGNCLRMLITHLPTVSLPNNKSLFMMKAHAFLDRFGKLLHKEKLSDEEMDDLFKGDEVSNSKKSELCKTRIILLRLLKSLKGSLKLPNFLDKYLIQEFCLKGAFLIFCTVSSSMKLYSDEVEPLDLLVIDEAAQLKECESLIPLQLPGIRHAVLIGDECQLPAMLKSKVSEKAHFGRSLFERLVSLGHMKHLLGLQYRMHPKISRFPNSTFYSNRILNAENVKLKSYERHYLPGRMYGPYSFINVDSGKEIFEDGHSPKNMVEVAVVLQLVKNLFEASVASRKRLGVGIISPYKAQVVAIQEKLGKTYEKESYFAVNVKSIDGFQGGEEDVIIISTVRSNSSGKVGFLANPQRMNVALTRAKHCLWVLGDGSTLSKSGSFWAKLVVDARNRACYFDVDEDKSLVDAIIDVNIEQGHLYNLLHTESLLFCKARWKVLFSDDFKKSLTRIKIAQTRKEVIALLMKLANGWRPKGENLNFANGSSFKLLKQYNVGGQYLLWTIDIMKDSNYKQVMKFWNILPSAEVPKLIRRLDTIFTKYSKDYISKCKLISTEKELEVPMSWKKIPKVLLPDDQCKSESGEELLSHLASLNLDKKPNSPSSSSRDQSSSYKNLRDFDTIDDLSSQLASLSLHKNHTAVSKKIWKTSKPISSPFEKRYEKIPDLSSNGHLIDEGSHSKKKNIDEENPGSSKSKRSEAKASSQFSNNAKQVYQAKTKKLSIKG